MNRREAIKGFLAGGLVAVGCHADAGQTPLLVQLHWQDPRNISRTRFVAQAGHTSFEDFQAWFEDVITRRRHECPEGWGPMICTQDSEHFVLAARP